MLRGSVLRLEVDATSPAGDTGVWGKRFQAAEGGQESGSKAWLTSHFWRGARAKIRGRGDDTENVPVTGCGLAGLRGGHRGGGLAWRGAGGKGWQGLSLRGGSAGRNRERRAAPRGRAAGGGPEAPRARR